MLESNRSDFTGYFSKKINSSIFIFFLRKKQINVKPLIKNYKNSIQLDFQIVSKKKLKLEF